LSIRDFSFVVLSEASEPDGRLIEKEKTMKRSICYQTALLCLGTLCLGAGTAGKEVTPTEREQALRYLADTRAGVVEAVKGLSEAQWKFKPAPDRWSAAEVVEHLALIEDVVHGILGNIEKAPAAASDRDVKQTDAMILARVPDRSTKFQAPEGAQPTGHWTPDGALQHFLTTRGEVEAILRSTPDLRGHIVNHPVFGPMDGYQWVLAVAAHSERHTKQILEVKSDPHFPAN
jgi:hypothetical protein